MSRLLSTYDAIGTYASPVTLTATASDNTFSKECELYDKMSIKFKYTPKAGQTNRYAKVYLYESDDNTNWFSRAIRISGIDVIDIYDVDPAGAVGIYEKIPNGGTSTGGTAYTGVYNLELSGSKYFKIQVAEDGVADFGTLYIGVALINSSN